MSHSLDFSEKSALLLTTRINSGKINSKKLAPLTKLQKNEKNINLRNYIKENSQVLLKYKFISFKRFILVPNDWSM